MAAGIAVAVAVRDDDARPDVALAGGPVDLPFGLEHVEGTEPIGRPAVYERVAVIQNGEPVTGLTLRAAYRVTADDPPAVVRAWADQLDGLALERVWVSGEADYPHSPWMQVGADGSDWASVDLWATGDGPILLVSATRFGEDPPSAAQVDDDAGSPPAPDPADIGPSGRTAGDDLFTEQGATLHLPKDTTALMATVPTMGGTGGSTSVLAADDARVALQALLDEAMAASHSGKTDGVETVPAEGDVEVLTADFVIPAGGWGFDVAAVQGPGDEAATLYVTSYAD